MATATAAKKLVVRDSWTGVLGVGYVGAFPEDMDWDEMRAQAAQRAAEAAERDQLALESRLRNRIVAYFGKEVRAEVEAMPYGDLLDLCPPLSLAFAS